MRKVPTIPKSTARIGHRPGHRPPRTRTFDESSESKDSDDRDAAPDELVPDPVVCDEFDISSMTLWRWDRDPELVALGFPPPVFIRRRKYRSRQKLEKFKRTVLHRTVTQREQA
jgi:hypothetical protein